MKQQRSIGKRLLSFTVSCVTAASFLPAAFWQNTFAAAAEQSANEKELKAEAFKALGLSTKNPSGFDEKDEEKNPFGKETVAFAGADELLIAAMGGSDNRIIGQNAGTVGQLLPVGLRDESLKMIFSDTATTLGPGGSKCSPTYISELALATDTEDLEDDDFNVLDADINKGTSVFAPHIYLGYKTTKDISKAITDIIVVDRGSSNTAPNNYSANGHNYHLTDYSRDGGWSNFKNTNGNLNAGAKSGKNLYLYYSTDKISPEYLEGQSFTQAVTRIHLDSNSNDAVSGENLLGGTASAYNVYLHMDRALYSPVGFQGEANYGSNIMQTNPYLNETAGGNFDGNLRGEKKQYAMAAYDPESEKFLLSICDPTYHFTSTSMEIGDYRNRDAAAAWAQNSNFTEDDAESLQAIASLEIVTGDFNGNGTDQVAVYAPKTNNPHVLILTPPQISDDEADEERFAPLYDIGNWSTYSLALDAANADSPVSLAAGDVDNDGADDLLIGSGSDIWIYRGNKTGVGGPFVKEDKDQRKLQTETVYDPDIVVFSSAAQKSQPGKRTAKYFAVLGKTADTNNASVGGLLTVYGFIGGEFVPVSAKEVSISQPGAICKAGSLTTLASSYDIWNLLAGFWYREADLKTVAYLPFPSELHCMNDMLLSPYLEKSYQFTPGGLNEKEHDKVNAPYAGNSVLDYSYIWNAGSYGYLRIFYDFQPAILNADSRFNQTTAYKIFVSTGKSQEHMVGAYSTGMDRGLQMLPTSCSDRSKPYCYAVLNTDTDTSVMHYNGDHWVDFTNPQVLAVLASPPYFKDLKNDSSGSTAFEKSTEQGTGTTESSTISAGAYLTISEDIGVANFEVEVTAKTSFTEEYAESSSISFSSSYETSLGSDAVVLYSIPVECYRYQVDYKGKQFEQIVHIPRSPSTQVVPMEKYQLIAERYDFLPQINETLLKHRLGDPASYPTSTNGDPLAYESDLSSVTTGDQSVTKSIGIAKGDERAYTDSFSIEGKAGGGAFGVTAGITAEYEQSAGKVFTSTSATTFSGTISNLPEEAEEFGYQMSWKLYLHKGSYTDESGQLISFPIVDYIVEDGSVSQPPQLPDNFRQNYRTTTADRIGLEWEYENPLGATAFNLYRITEFEDSSDEVLIGTVDTADGKKNEDGMFVYQFTDTGKDAEGKKIKLGAGQEYVYCIKTLNGSAESMLSPKLKAYTSANVEYPDITLSGVENGTLVMYSNQEGYSVEAVVSNADVFQSIRYQWQRRLTGVNRWADMSDREAELIPPKDDAEYRCRIHAVNNGAMLTVYSDTFKTVCKKRTVKATEFKAECAAQTADLSLTLEPVSSECFSAPSGKAEFIFSQNGQKVKTLTAELLANEASTASTAVLQTSELENGFYQVSAFYGGDMIYNPFETGEQTILVCAEDETYNGIVLEKRIGEDEFERTRVFYVGDVMIPRHYVYSRTEDGEIIETLVESGEETVLEEAGEFTRVQIGERDLRFLTVPIYYDCPYTVLKYKIEITLNQPDLLVGEVDGNLADPEVTGGAFRNNTDTIKDLVCVRYYQSLNGDPFTPDDGTQAGTYYAKLELSGAEGNLTKYYDVTLKDCMFSISEASYSISICAVPYHDEAVGTITMKKPESIGDITESEFQYGSSAKIELKAMPEKGYVLDYWQVNEKEKYYSDTLSFQMKSHSYSIEAHFKEHTGKVSIITERMKGGSIELPEGFVSGQEVQIGQQLTFTMQADQDYVPDYWVKKTGNSATQSNIAQASVTVEVGEQPIFLYPVFKPAPCKIILDSRLTATYSYTDEDGEQQTKVIRSGSTVPKFSTVSLKLNDGAKIGEDEIWMMDEKEITPLNNSFVFAVKGDTSVRIADPLVETTTEDPALTTTETTSTTAKQTTTTTTTAATTSATEPTTAATTKTTPVIKPTTVTTTKTTSATKPTTVATTKTTSATKPTTVATTKTTPATKPTTVTTTKTTPVTKQTTVTTTKTTPVTKPTTVTTTTTTSAMKPTTVTTTTTTSASKPTTVATTTTTPATKPTTIATTTKTTPATDPTIVTTTTTTPATEPTTVTTTTTTPATEPTTVTTTKTTSATKQTTVATTKTTPATEPTTVTTTTTTPATEPTTVTTTTTTPATEPTTETSESSTTVSTETAPTETEPVETTPAEPEYLLGDVNDDGEVSVDDAQLTLIEYVSAMTGKAGSFTEKQKLAGDINGDRQISVEDAQFILLYYVKNTLSGGNVTWDELLGKTAKPQTLPAILKKRLQT